MSGLCSLENTYQSWYPLVIIWDGVVWTYTCLCFQLFFSFFLLIIAPEGFLALLISIPRIILAGKVINSYTHSPSTPLCHTTQAQRHSIMTSNSSLTGSGGAYSSDMEESNFLKRNRVIHFARLGLSSLIFGVAIAVVACEAPPLRHYKNTSQWASAGLALWPLNFDLRPTIAAISCGCIVTILNLVYIAVALLPSVSLTPIPLCDYPWYRVLTPI